MNTGRPRDEAPEGYVTVREAADLLGLSQSAVRNRIRKKTIEVMDEATDGGEPRYYIPINAIRSEVERSGGVATTGDVEQTEAHLEGKVQENRELVERLGGEVIEAIYETKAEVSAQRTEVVEALDRISRELSTLNRQLDQRDKDAAKDRETLRLYVERGEANRVAERLSREAAPEAEAKVETRAPWWRRLLGLADGG